MIRRDDRGSRRASCRFAPRGRSPAEAGSRCPRRTEGGGQFYVSSGQNRVE